MTNPYLAPLKKAIDKAARKNCCDMFFLENCGLDQQVAD